MSLAAEYDEPDSKQGTVEATPYLGTVHVGVFPGIEIGDTQIPQIISAMGHTSGIHRIAPAYRFEKSPDDP